MALLRAAVALKIERAQSGQGATLLELVHRSQVGYAVARTLVPKLKRRGQLTQVGKRRVPYCNKPVAEYAPASPGPDLAAQGTAQGLGWVHLSQCLGSWTK